MNISLLLFIAAILCEFSPFVDTKSYLKKLAIGLIAVGAVIDSTGRNNDFVEAGAVLFFGTCAIRTFYENYKRSKKAKLKFK